MSIVGTTDPASTARNLIMGASGSASLVAGAEFTLAATGGSTGHGSIVASGNLDTYSAGYTSMQSAGVMVHATTSNHIMTSTGMTSIQATTSLLSAADVLLAANTAGVMSFISESHFLMNANAGMLSATGALSATLGSSGILSLQGGTSAIFSGDDTATLSAPNYVNTQSNVVSLYARVQRNSLAVDSVDWSTGVASLIGDNTLLLQSGGPSSGSIYAAANSIISFYTLGHALYGSDRDLVLPAQLMASVYGGSSLQLLSCGPMFGVGAALSLAATSGDLQLVTDSGGNVLLYGSSHVSVHGASSMTLFTEGNAVLKSNGASLSLVASENVRTQAAANIYTVATGPSSSHSLYGAVEMNVYAGDNSAGTGLLVASGGAAASLYSGTTAVVSSPNTQIYSDGGMGLTSNQDSMLMYSNGGVGVSIGSAQSVLIGGNAIGIQVDTAENTVFSGPNGMLSLSYANINMLAANDFYANLGRDFSTTSSGFTSVHGAGNAFVTSEQNMVLAGWVSTSIFGGTSGVRVTSNADFAMDVVSNMKLHANGAFSIVGSGSGGILSTGATTSLAGQSGVAVLAGLAGIRATTSGDVQVSTSGAAVDLTALTFANVNAATIQATATTDVLVAAPVTSLYGASAQLVANTRLDVSSNGVLSLYSADTQYLTGGTNLNIAVSGATNAITIAATDGKLLTSVASASLYSTDYTSIYGANMVALGTSPGGNIYAAAYVTSVGGITSAILNANGGGGGGSGTTVINSGGTTSISSAGEVAVVGGTALTMRAATVSIYSSDSSNTGLFASTASFVARMTDPGGFISLAAGDNFNLLTSGNAGVVGERTFMSVYGTTVSVVGDYYAVGNNGGFNYPHTSYVGNAFTLSENNFVNIGSGNGLSLTAGSVDTTGKGTIEISTPNANVYLGQTYSGAGSVFVKGADGTVAVGSSNGVAVAAALGSGASGLLSLLSGTDAVLSANGVSGGAGGVMSLVANKQLLVNVYDGVSGGLFSLYAHDNGWARSGNWYQEAGTTLSFSAGDTMVGSAPTLVSLSSTGNVVLKNGNAGGALSLYSAGQMLLTSADLTSLYVGGMLAVSPVGLLSLASAGPGGIWEASGGDLSLSASGSNLLATATRDVLLTGGSNVVMRATTMALAGDPADAAASVSLYAPLRLTAQTNALLSLRAGTHFVASSQDDVGNFVGHVSLSGGYVDLYAANTVSLTGQAATTTLGVFINTPGIASLTGDTQMRVHSALGDVALAAPLGKVTAAGSNDFLVGMGGDVSLGASGQLHQRATGAIVHTGASGIQLNSNGDLSFFTLGGYANGFASLGAILEYGGDFTQRQKGMLSFYSTQDNVYLGARTSNVQSIWGGDAYLTATANEAQVYGERNLYLASNTGANGISMYAGGGVNGIQMYVNSPTVNAFTAYSNGGMNLYANERMILGANHISVNAQNNFIVDAVTSGTVSGLVSISSKGDPSSRFYAYAMGEMSLQGFAGTTVATDGALSLWGSTKTHIRSNDDASLRAADASGATGNLYVQGGSLVSLYGAGNFLTDIRGGVASMYASSIYHRALAGGEVSYYGEAAALTASESATTGNLYLGGRSVVINGNNGMLSLNTGQSFFSHASYGVMSANHASSFAARVTAAMYAGEDLHLIANQDTSSLPESGLVSMFGNNMVQIQAGSSGSSTKGNLYITGSRLSSIYGLNVAVAAETSTPGTGILSLSGDTIKGISTGNLYMGSPGTASVGGALSAILASNNWAGVTLNADSGTSLGVLSLFSNGGVGEFALRSNGAGMVSANGLTIGSGGILSFAGPDGYAFAQGSGPFVTNANGLSLASNGNGYIAATGAAAGSSLSMYSAKDMFLQTANPGTLSLSAANVILGSSSTSGSIYMIMPTTGAVNTQLIMKDGSTSITGTSRHDIVVQDGSGNTAALKVGGSDIVGITQGYTSLYAATNAFIQSGDFISVTAASSLHMGVSAGTTTDFMALQVAGSSSGGTTEYPTASTGALSLVGTFVTLGTSLGCQGGTGQQCTSGGGQVKIANSALVLSSKKTLTCSSSPQAVTIAELMTYSMIVIPGASCASGFEFELPDPNVAGGLGARLEGTTLTFIYDHYSDGLYNPGSAHLSPVTTSDFITLKFKGNPSGPAYFFSVRVYARTAVTVMVYESKWNGASVYTYSVVGGGTQSLTTAPWTYM